MASYFVEGGYRLEGEVEISGSKNSSLGVVAAAMLLDGPCVLENVPHIEDIKVLLDICKDLGADIDWSNPKSLKIDPRGIHTHSAVGVKVRNIRASYYLLGALMGRKRKAVLDFPGGCNFGTRPIDLHQKGFEALGAKVNIAGGLISIEAKNLKGNYIFLDQVSVGATINIMIAATKTPGLTTIENAAREPHIVDVANFLNLMGANIRGAGTDMIRIQGVDALPADKTFSIIPDQIEAGTFMIAAAMTDGDITVKNVIPRHMEPLSAKLEEMGVEVLEGDDWIRVIKDPKIQLKPTVFRTLPYPGFPTDLQPQATTLLVRAQGLSKMFENVWDNRYQYIDYLKMMGAQITVSGKMALVQGPTALTSARLKARDLRAGAAMLLAALAADGVSEVYNIHVLERGYENLMQKLTALGARMRVEYDEN